MNLKAWLGCLGVVVCVAAACSGADGKKAVRDSAGAGGDDAESGAGGQRLPSDGGSDGSATAGIGGVPSQAGAGAAAGAAGADAGATGTAGAGGQPSLPVSLESVQGTWTGQVLSSYVCESDLRNIELTIDGSSVTSTFPSVEDLGTGDIVHQDGQSFTFDLFIDNPNFDQNYKAQLFVDPNSTYALFVALHSDADGPGNSLDVALLQKAAQAPLDAVVDDYFGSWSGPSFALDGDLAVARTLDATAVFTNESNGDVSVQDDDGDFSGVLEEAQFATGAWIAPQMYLAPNELGGMFLLSNDKQAMAVALLRKLDPNDGALCDLTDPFADMSVHKFGLWIKAQE